MLPSPPQIVAIVAGSDTMKSDGDCDVAPPSAIVTETQLGDASVVIALLTARRSAV